MEYKLERSKRKTLTICIANGEVTVKAPLNTTVRHIEEFLAQKSGWIHRKLTEQSRRADILSNVIGGECFMYRGRFLSVELADKVKRVALSDNSILVPAKYADKPAQNRAIIAFYKRVALRELENELARVAALTGLKYANFALTNARTKWGSCDGKNSIRLNWRLVMLDDELMRYVIVHELAHTVHHDHSAAFWAEVKKYMPGYAAAKKRLKTFSVLTTLYR